ncbi:MAG: S-methyl-5'-thioadenosine phosphorylase [Herpetosiphon sp.]
MESARVGVIGGSGLYEMPGLTDREERTISTPFGDPSDRFILGTLQGVRVAFLPRHGRGHRLLPAEVPNRANMYAFKQLGVQRLLSVSAVGSLRETLPPGQIVVPDQLVDRTRGQRPPTFFGAGIVAHVQFDRPFCPELRSTLAHTMQSMALPVVDRATYVVIEGPQFSTLAESEFHRAQGFDLVGMTALPEARLAREAELCYATLALVTDFDCWHPSHDTVTVEAVMSVMRDNISHAQAILAAIIPTLAGARSCRCGHALAGAIMTAPEHIPAATRERLALLVDRYL